MSQEYNVYFNIQYGTDQCQFVNFYLPFGSIAGTIMRIHGEYWNSGNQAPYPEPNNISNDASVMASSGYAVIDVNYRGKNNSYGATGNGIYPNNINDIKKVLEYCLVNGAGSPYNPIWQLIYNTQINNSGIIVSGIGAGAHLALYSVCDFGTENDIWPLSVFTSGGFFNLSYPDVFIDPLIQNEINAYVTSTDDLRDASPYFKYGTQENPGPWFVAVNNSACKFIFLQNNYDTLTSNAVVIPTVESFKKNNPNTTVTLINQGPPQGAFPGITAVTYKGITTDRTIETLPRTGNKLGDAYYCPDTFDTYWVYNQGIYTGDNVNPQSLFGFTRWFNHNYSS